MEKAWLDIFGKMTYGLYLLTTSYREEINGMIASWVSQVSYDPPLIMVAIHPNRYSHHLVRQCGSFALHVLARNQTHLLGVFKGPDPSAKFDSINWSRGKNNCPILKDCLAFLECEVKAEYTPGNHTLFIGEVKSAEAFSNESPLTTLDYAGTYIGKD